MATVKIEGIPQLRADFNSFVKELRDLGVMHDIAIEGAVVMSRLAPRRTGALQASVRPNQSTNKAVVRAGSRKVRYAQIIDLGGEILGLHPHTVPAQHFRRSTDAIMTPRAEQMIEKSIRSEISKRGLQP